MSDCEWTQVRSVGPLSLENCDIHRNEFRVNDETIVYAQTEADRSRIYNEFTWVVHLWEDSEEEARA